MIWTKKPPFGLCFTEFYWTLFRDLKGQRNTCLISMTKAAPLPSRSTETSQKHRNKKKKKPIIFNYLLTHPSTHCSHFYFHHFLLLLGVFNQWFLTHLITACTIFIHVHVKSQCQCSIYLWTTIIDPLKVKVKVHTFVQTINAVQVCSAKAVRTNLDSQK